MINYLFGSLRSCEKSISSISLTLRKQASLNRWLTAVSLGLTAGMYLQDRQIRRLTAQLEELKHPEGE